MPDTIYGQWEREYRSIPVRPSMYSMPLFDDGSTKKYPKKKVVTDSSKKREELLKKFKLDPRTDDELVEVGIKLLTADVRASLLAYFKGHDFVQGKRDMTGKIMLEPARGYSASFFYQRRERELENTMKLYLYHESTTTVLATLMSEPRRLVLRTENLSRSPEMSRVHDNVKNFMDKYLPGVELEERRASLSDRVDDREMFMSIARRGVATSATKKYDKVQQYSPGMWVAIDEIGSVRFVDEAYARESRRQHGA